MIESHPHSYAYSDDSGYDDSDLDEKVNESIEALNWIDERLQAIERLQKKERINIVRRNT